MINVSSSNFISISVHFRHSPNDKLKYCVQSCWKQRQNSIAFANKVQNASFSHLIEEFIVMLIIMHFQGPE